MTVLLWSEMVSRVGGEDVCMMLTFFFFHAPLPALIFSLYLLYKPVLEYRDKLFTHSNQKPASKERVNPQGIVKLSLSPQNAPFLTHPPKLHPSSPLCNLLTNQVTYASAPRFKPLTKTLWDIVLIIADFVAALLGAVVFHKPKWLL